MSQFDTPDRRHVIKFAEDSARIELRGSRPQYKWAIDLTATRRERFVEVKVLDRLVVDFTPEEARDFARALLKVAAD